MGKGRNLQEFTEILHHKTKESIEIQTQWVTVKKIDWTAKHMTVKGLIDDLDFQHVLLGLGAVFVKPSVGSKCLVGLINNNPARAFLLEAEEIDALEIKDKSGFKTVLNNGKIQIKNKETSLFTILTDLAKLLKALKVSTPSGPSGTPLPMSMQAISEFETNLGKLMN